MFGWKELLRLFGFSLSQGLALGDMGTALSVGGSLIGGAMNADAAGDAAGQSNAGLLQAIETLKGVDSRTRADTSPYRTLGSNSVNRLSYLLGLTPIAGGNNPYGGQSLVSTSGGAPTYNQDLYNSDANYRKAWDQVAAQHKAKYGTGYTGDSDAAWIENRVRALLPQATDLDTSDGQYGSLLKNFSYDDLNNDVVYNTGLKFGLDQGLKAINNRALATGSYDSGATDKAIAQWGNDYGTTKAEGAYNRYNADKNNKYSMLTGTTNIGQNAVNTSANTGAAIGSAIAGAQSQIGANNAASTVGQANAWSNALGGATNAYGLNSILSKIGGGSSGTGNAFNYANLANAFGTSMAGY